MVTDRAILPILGLLAVGLGGCLSSSISSDLRTVRELSRADVARVADADVPVTSDEDVRPLLGEPLDADRAVHVALLNNRALRASLRELGIARGRVIQAGLLPNPVVEAEVLPERNTELELRVEYDITAALLAPLRARAASSELEAERIRVAGAVILLGYDVRAAFYRLQSAEQRLAIGRRSLDLAVASRDAARALYEAGNVPALDARTQEATYERARVAVAQLELEVADRVELLQRLLGVHGAATGWRTVGPLPAAPRALTPPQKAETRALEASLELGEARSRLEAVARRIGATRTEGWLPDISIDVHTLYGNPEPIVGQPPPNSWRVGGGVSVRLPIFDRRQGIVIAQKAELEGSRERYIGMAIDIRSAARETRNRLVSAHARARQYEDMILPAQRRVTEQTLLQYNAMQVGVFPLLQARREELDAQLSYVETLREYWTAAAALDALFAGRRVGAIAPASGNTLGANTAGPGGH